MASLSSRAATTRTRGGSGALSSAFTSSRSMAATFEVRAHILVGEMRRAHGRAGSIVFQARKRIMKETIYDRKQVIGPPPKRKLTGNLYRSEKIVMAGDTIRFDNTAKYAHLRHAMSGTSKLYGHKLDSFWAARAMQQTAATRAKIYRDALAVVWSAHS